MQDARTGVWRFEYQTDMTRAGSAIVPLAFMVEAGWQEGGRWLGMLLRLSLTRNELEAADLVTWPELNEPEPFLRAAFEEAWIAPPGEAGLFLARKYSGRGALRLVPQKAAPILATLCQEGPGAKAFGDLTAYLWTFKEWLHPALKADVVDIANSKRRRRIPSEPKVAEVLERAEAA